MTDNHLNHGMQGEGARNEGPLNEAARLQMDRWLDDDLSAEESADLLQRLDSDPRLAAALAERAWLVSALHKSLQRRRLQNLALDEAGLSSTPAGLELRVAPQAASFQAAVVSAGMPPTASGRRRWTATGFAAIAAILLIAVFFWPGEAISPAAAASLTLDRMIEVASQPIDRMYRIRVTDFGPDGPEPQVFEGGKGRKPSVDGAELYVRGSDKFVLVRQFGNGTKFITGSDGKLGWAVAPRGHVHLSKDARRFRRAVPGEHEEIPFLDLKSGLSELRRAYELKLVPADDADAKAHGWSRLDAVQRSSHPGAPRKVHLWFDAAGVARRIELTGIPVERERPRGVMLELVEQKDLGPDFFKHETQHSPDRPVDWE